MDTQAVIILILIGLAAGLLSGLVGIGGGIVLVPSLVYFMSYSQHQAQGTSLGVLILPVVLLAFLTYYKQGRSTGAPIEFAVIALLAVGFVFGGLLGSKIAVGFNQDTLKKIFAVLLFYTGIKLLEWDVLMLKWLKNWFH